MSSTTKLGSKIRLMRQSGLPLDLDKYQAYQDEYVKMADKIAERAKLDMLKSARMYRFIEHLLKRKYGSEVQISVPRSKKAIKDLVIQFGTPITLAVTADGQDVIGILLDEMQ